MSQIKFYSPDVKLVGERSFEKPPLKGEFVLFYPYTYLILGKMHTVEGESYLVKKYSECDMKSPERRYPTLTTPTEVII